MLHLNVTHARTHALTKAAAKITEAFDLGMGTPGLCSVILQKAQDWHYDPRDISYRGARQNKSRLSKYSDLQASLSMQRGI